MLLAALASAALLACSGDDYSSGPVSYVQGTISVYNESLVSIRLTDFVQTRGELEHRSVLNITLYPNQSRYLHNMLDGGETNVFPGGDHVSVKFRSSQNDPENPRRPLFENTASLIINGNNTILVKSGGEVSIGPGE